MHACSGFVQVYPQTKDQARLDAPSDESESGVICIPAKAGDAVVFLSK